MCRTGDAAYDTLSNRGTGIFHREYVSDFGNASKVVFIAFGASGRAAKGHSLVEVIIVRVKFIETSTAL
jgi:hypothetical protein